MKVRSDNETHRQRFQGRHVRLLAPPVEAEQKGKRSGPDLEGEGGNERDEKSVAVLPTVKTGSKHARSAL